MMLLYAWLWVIIGGVLEPIWVIGLKRSNNFKNLKWALFTILIMLASPLCLSFAMQEIPVGTAYAVWTGIGAVFTLVAGMIFYKEKIERIQILFIFIIIVGVAGLALEGAA